MKSIICSVCKGEGFIKGEPGTCKFCGGQGQISVAGKQTEQLHLFSDFDEALIERQKAWVQDGEGDKLPVEFYAIELVGELGELFNVIKKLMREQYGVRGSRATLQDKEDEFGDVLICLKNMAAKYGVDLESVARRKFNATSEKYGFPHRVTTDA
jgi:NTP pyrophosphatase (non-canonical NTP hydrolase)